MHRDLLGFLAGLVVAAVTTPVGVSGAVFLLPVQLTVLGVPNPRLTPTNLLYNVVAGPGALIGHARSRRLRFGLVGRIIIGSAPGVAVGAVLRVTVAADATTFRVVTAVVLVPTGLLVLRKRGPRTQASWASTGPALLGLAFTVGVVGGLYGIGGGSLLAPLLVAAGMTVRDVAPAALAATFLTSIVGVLTFAVLATRVEGQVSPDWSLGLACGLGGLVGGYIGARAQPHVPERALRLLLGMLAITLGLIYAGQALR